MDPDALLRHCLLLDLETAPDGRLLKVGAVLGPRTERPSPASAPAVLGELAAQATCVLGHNLVAHDLSILRASDPHHPILSLPVVDTLILSPLCFPENPYHHLVKDYKLVRESLNDPVAAGDTAPRYEAFFSPYTHHWSNDEEHKPVVALSVSRLLPNDRYCGVSVFTMLTSVGPETPPRYRGVSHD